MCTFGVVVVGTLTRISKAVGTGHCVVCTLTRISKAVGTGQALVTLGWKKTQIIIIKKSGTRI